jgi:hypothetical protein
VKARFFQNLKTREQAIHSRKGIKKKESNLVKSLEAICQIFVETDYPLIPFQIFVKTD